MCNKFVQGGVTVSPQGKAIVLIRGPGGEFEMECEAIFGGPARKESKAYWKGQMKAEDCLVPDVEQFGEKDKATGVQNWEAVPAGTTLQGLLLPEETAKKTGKPYRLLKVVTQDATAEQAARLGNDRVPVFGVVEPSGKIRRVEPSPPPEKAQGDLFA